MANQVGTNSLTARYRKHLEDSGTDTSLYTDEDLTYQVGKLIESRGKLDNVTDPKFKQQYLDVKNRPSADMQGILGYPKELYRAARMTTLGMAGTAFNAAAIPFSGSKKTEGIHDWLTTRAKGFQEAAAEKTPTIVRPTDIRWNNADEAIRGTLSMFGQAAPSLLQSLTFGRISAGGGKAVGKALSKRIPEDAMVVRKVNGFNKNISKREDFINRMEMGGMVTGMAMNSIGMSAGEIYSSLLPYTELDATDPDYVEVEDARAAALIGGAMSGSLESFFPAHLLTKFMRGAGKEGAGYWWRFVSSLPKNITIEGATEGMQELINMMSEKYARGHEMTWSAMTSDEKRRLIDAGALGAVGGMQGTVLEALHDPDTGPVTATDQELEDFERIARDYETERQAAAQISEEQLSEDTTAEFAKGDTVIDTSTGVSGEYVGEDDNSFFVSSEGEQINIPKQSAAYVTPEAAVTSVSKGDLVTYTGDADVSGLVKKVTPTTVTIKDDNGDTYELNRNEVKVDKEGVQIAMDASFDKATTLGDRNTPESLTKQDYFNLIRREGSDPTSFWNEDTNQPTEQGKKIVDKYMKLNIDGYEVDRVWNGRIFTGYTSPAKAERMAKAAERNDIIDGLIQDLKDLEKDLYNQPNETAKSIGDKIRARIRQGNESRSDLSYIIKQSLARLDKYKAGKFEETTFGKNEAKRKQELREQRSRKRELFEGLKTGNYPVFKYGNQPVLVGSFQTADNNHLVEVHNRKGVQYVDAKDLSEYSTVTDSERSSLAEINKPILKRRYKNTLPYKQEPKKVVPPIKKTATKKPSAKKPSTKKPTTKKPTPAKGDSTPPPTPSPSVEFDVSKDDDITSVLQSFGRNNDEVNKQAVNRAYGYYNLSPTADKEAIKAMRKAEVKRVHPDTRPKGLTEEERKIADARFLYIQAIEEVIEKGDTSETAYTNLIKTEKELNEAIKPEPEEDESLSAYAGDITRESVDLIYKIGDGAPIGVDHEASYIIDKLSSEVGSSRGRAAMALIQRIKGLGVLDNIKVKFESDLESSIGSKARVLGKYNYNKRRVSISDKYSTSLGDPSGDMAIVLAHELLHPVFRSAKQQDELSEYISDLESVYQSLKEREGFEFRNIEEFFVSFLSDKDFAESLKLRNSPDGFFANLWEWVVSIVRRVFGISDPYSEASAAAYTILDEYSKIESKVNNLYDLGDGDQYMLVEQKASTSTDRKIYEDVAKIITIIMNKRTPRTRVELEDLVRQSFNSYPDQQEINRNFSKWYQGGLRVASRSIRNIPTNDVDLTELKEAKVFGSNKKEQIDFIMGEYNLNSALKLHNKYAILVNQILSEASDSDDYVGMFTQSVDETKPSSMPIAVNDDGNLIQTTPFEYIEGRWGSKVLAWYYTDYLYSRFENIINPFDKAIDHLRRGKQMKKIAIKGEWGNPIKPNTGIKSLDNKIAKEALIQYDNFRDGGIQLLASERQDLMSVIMGGVPLDGPTSLVNYGAKKFNYGTSARRVDMDEVSSGITYEDQVIDGDTVTLGDIVKLVEIDSPLSADDIRRIIIEKTEEASSKRGKLDLTETNKALIKAKGELKALQEDLAEAKATLASAPSEDRAQIGELQLSLIRDIVQREQFINTSEEIIKKGRGSYASITKKQGSDEAFLMAGTQIVVPRAVGAASEAQASQRRINNAEKRIQQLEEERRQGGMDPELISKDISRNKVLIENEKRQMRPMLSSSETRTQLANTFGQYQLGNSEVALLEGDVTERQETALAGVPHSKIELRKPQDPEIVSRILSGTLYEATQSTVGKSQDLFARTGKGIRDNKNQQRTYYQFRNKTNGIVALTGVWASTKEQPRISVKEEMVPELTKEGEAAFKAQHNEGLETQYLGLHYVDGQPVARYLLEVPSDDSVQYTLLELGADHEYIKNTRGGKMKLRPHGRPNINVVEGSSLDRMMATHRMVFHDAKGGSFRLMYAMPVAKKDMPKSVKKRIKDMGYVGRKGNKLVFEDDAGKTHEYNKSEFKTTSNGQAIEFEYKIESPKPRSGDLEMSVSMFMEPSSLIGGVAGDRSGRSISDFLIENEDWAFTGESVQFNAPPMDAENNRPKTFYYASESAYQFAKSRAQSVGMDMPEAVSRYAKTASSIEAPREAIRNLRVKEIENGGLSESERKLLRSHIQTLTNVVNSDGNIINEESGGFNYGSVSKAKMLKASADRFELYYNQLSDDDTYLIGSTSVDKEMLSDLKQLASIEADISIEEARISDRLQQMSYIMNRLIYGLPEGSDEYNAIKRAIKNGKTDKLGDAEARLVSEYRNLNKKKVEPLDKAMERWNRYANSTKGELLRVIMEAMTQMESGRFGDRMHKAVNSITNNEENSDIPLAGVIIEALYGPIRRVMSTENEPSVSDKFSTINRGEQRTGFRRKRPDKVWLEKLYYKSLGDISGGSTTQRAESDFDSGFIAGQAATTPDVYREDYREVEFTESTTIEKIAEDQDVIRRAGAASPKIYLLEYNKDIIEEALGRGALDISPDGDYVTPRQVDGFISNLNNRLHDVGNVVLRVPVEYAPSNSGNSITYQAGDEEAVAEGTASSSDKIRVEDLSPEETSAIHGLRYESFDSYIDQVLSEGATDPQTVIDYYERSAGFRDIINDLNLLESRHSDIVTESAASGGNPIMLSTVDKWQGGFYDPEPTEQGIANSFFQEYTLNQRELAVFSEDYVFELYGRMKDAEKDVSSISREESGYRDARAKFGFAKDSYETALKRHKSAVAYGEMLQAFLSDTGIQYMQDGFSFDLVEYSPLSKRLSGEMVPNAGTDTSEVDTWTNSGWAAGINEVIEVIDESTMTSSFGEGDQSALMEAGYSEEELRFKRVSVPLSERPDAALPILKQAQADLLSLAMEADYMSANDRVMPKSKYKETYGVKSGTSRHKKDTEIFKGTDPDRYKTLDYNRLRKELTAPRPVLTYAREIGYEKIQEAIEEVRIAVDGAKTPIVTKGMLADYVYYKHQGTKINVKAQISQTGKRISGVKGRVGRRTPDGRFTTNPFLVLPPSQVSSLMDLYTQFATYKIDETLSKLMPQSTMDSLTEPVSNPADLEPMQRLARVMGGGDITEVTSLPFMGINRMSERIKQDPRPQAIEASKIASDVMAAGGNNMQLVNEGIKTLLGDRYPHTAGAKYIEVNGVKIKANKLSVDFKKAMAAKLESKEELERPSEEMDQPTEFLSLIFDQYFSKNKDVPYQMRQALRQHPKTMLAAIEAFSGENNDKVRSDLREARENYSQLKNFGATDAISSIAKDLKLALPDMYGEILEALRKSGDVDILTKDIQYGDGIGPTAETISKEPANIGSDVIKLARELGIDAGQLSQGFPEAVSQAIYEQDQGEQKYNNADRNYTELLNRRKWLKHIKSSVENALKRAGKATKLGAKYEVTAYDIYYSKRWEEPKPVTVGEGRIIAGAKRLVGFSEQIEYNAAGQASRSIRQLIKQIDRQDRSGATNSIVRESIDEYRANKDLILGASKYEIRVGSWRIKKNEPNYVDRIRDLIEYRRRLEASEDKRMPKRKALLKKMEESLSEIKDAKFKQDPQTLQSEIEGLNVKIAAAKRAADPDIIEKARSRIEELSKKANNLKGLAGQTAAQTEYVNVLNDLRNKEKAKADADKNLPILEKRLREAKADLNKIDKKVISRLEDVAPKLLKGMTEEGYLKVQQSHIDSLAKEIEDIDIFIDEAKQEHDKAKKEAETKRRDAVKAIQKHYDLSSPAKSVRTARTALEYLASIGSIPPSKSVQLSSKTKGDKVLELIQDIMSGYVSPTSFDSSEQIELDRIKKKQKDYSKLEKELVRERGGKSKLTAEDKSKLKELELTDEEKSIPQRVASGRLSGVKLIDYLSDSNIEQIRKNLNEIYKRSGKAEGILAEENLQARISESLGALQSAANAARTQSILISDDDMRGDILGMSMSDIEKLSPQEGNYTSPRDFVEDLVSKGAEVLTDIVENSGGFASNEARENFNKTVKKALGGELDESASPFTEYIRENKPELYDDENAIYYYSAIPLSQYWDALENRKWTEDALSFNDESVRANDAHVAQQGYNSLPAATPPISENARGQNQQAILAFLDGNAPQGSAISVINQLLSVGNADATVGRLIKLMRDLPAMRDVTVKFEPWEQFRVRTRNTPDGHITPAAYDSASKTIYISDAFTGSEKNAMPALINTLTHELLHPIIRNAISITENGLKLDRSLIESYVSKDSLNVLDAKVKAITDLYEYVKSKGMGGETYLHGTSSIDEFITETLTNSRFRDHLKSIRLDRDFRAKNQTSSWIRTAWDWVVDLVARMFNVQGRDAYDQAIDDINVIFDSYSDLTSELDPKILEEDMPEKVYNTVLQEQEAQEQEKESFNYDENRSYRAMWELAGINEVKSQLARTVMVMMNEYGYNPTVGENETPLDAFMREPFAKNFTKLINKEYKNQLRYVPEGTDPATITPEWGGNNTDFKGRASKTAIRLVEVLRKSMLESSSKLTTRIDNMRDGMEELQGDLNPEANKPAVATKLRNSFQAQISSARNILGKKEEHKSYDQNLERVAGLKGDKIVAYIEDFIKRGIDLTGEADAIASRISTLLDDAPTGSEMTFEDINGKKVAVGLAGILGKVISRHPVQVKLVELTTGTAPKALFDEIGGYKEYSKVRLQAEYNRLANDNSSDSEVRKTFLEGWMDYRAREEEVKGTEYNRDMAKNSADSLRPYSQILKIRLGAMAPFDLTQGAELIQVKKNGEKWEIQSEPYIINLDSRMLPEDREGFARVIRGNKDFLQDADQQKKYKGTPIWNIIKQQTQAAEAAPLQSEHAHARRATYFSVLQPIGQRFANMGPQGKAISAKLHQVVVEHKRHDPIFTASAKRWNVALSDAAKAFGYSNHSQFIEGPYSDALAWIEAQPQYMGRLEDAASKAFEYLKEHGHVNDRTKLDANARRAFLKLIRNTDKHRLLAKSLSTALGNKVADKYKSKPVLVESDITAGTFVQLYRDPLEIGAVTTSKRLHRGVQNIIEVASKLANTEPEEEDDLTTPEGAYAFFSKKIDNDIVDKFIEPYATMESMSDVFDSVGGTPLPQSAVQEAWRDASGEGVDKFMSWAGNIAQLTDANEIETGLSLLSQLRRYRKGIADAVKNADNLDVIQIAHSVQHKLMDARDLDTVMPREFYVYDSYDEVSSNIQLATIIANAVLGRGAEGLRQDRVSLMDKLRKKKSEFGELIKSAGGVIDTNSWKPNYRYSKKIVKAAEEILSKNPKYASDPKAAFEDLRSASMQQDQADKAFRHLEKYYGGKDGPYQDVRWLTEMLGLHAFMILSQPKSAMLNFLSIPDIFVFSRGLNKLGLKGTAKALHNVFDQTFGGIMEGFGIQMAKTHRYAQDTGEMFYHFKENELPFRDYNSFLGLRGVGKNNLVERSISGGFGLLPGMKALGQMGRYNPANVKDPTRQPLTARTMLPYVGDPFGYIGRMSNHSIAFGMASVYHDLVLETAKYLESNRMENDVNEVTAKDLGYGEGIGAVGIGSATLDRLVLGGEEGWSNYNNKAIDAGLGSITQMARDYLKRKAAGDKRVLTKDQTLSIGVIGLSDVALDGFLARAPWLYTNGFGRVISPLLGWSLARMNQVNEFIRTGDGRISMSMLIKYMSLVSASMVPVGLMAAAAMDVWDEDLLDKPNALQKVAPTQMIPFVGMFVNKEDPRYNAMAALERIGRTSSPYGLAYDVLAQMVAHADPTSSARSVSLDSRVLLFSQMQSYISILTTLAQQEGTWDYASVVRPFMYASGLNASFHYSQLLTNAMNIDSQERQIADITGLKNELRAASKVEKLALKPVMKFSMGTSKSNMYIRQMVRAAYSMDNDRFYEAYANAVAARRKELQKKGDATLPETSVLRSFKAFDPMRLVTQRKMTADEWARVSSRISPSAREKMAKIMQATDYYANILSP